MKFNNLKWRMFLQYLGDRKGEIILTIIIMVPIILCFVLTMLNPPKFVITEAPGLTSDSLNQIDKDLKNIDKDLNVMISICGYRG